MRILIAYDGSTSAGAIFDDLRIAGLPRRAEAVVLSVADAWLPPDGSPDQTVPGSGSTRFVPESRTRARQQLAAAVILSKGACDRLQKQFPEWKVEAASCADTPAWAIIKRAEHWPADLVIAGTGEQSALNRIAFGSVALKVLNELRCSVRLSRARTGGAAGPVRIVVGVDGSSDSLAAVQTVASRVWPGVASACVVTVIESTAAMVHPFPMFPTLDDVAEWGRHVAEHAENTLKACGLSVSTVVAHGDPKQVLLDEAARLNTDCIFVGARGVGQFERFLLGSVSTSVALRARCSVEVVHPKSADTTKKT